LSVGVEHRSGSLIYAMRMATPDMGRQRCSTGFLSGLGWEESLRATKLSA
jgi:hypothetical protein